MIKKSDPPNSSFDSLKILSAASFSRTKASDEASNLKLFKPKELIIKATKTNKRVRLGLFKIKSIYLFIKFMVYLLAHSGLSGGLGLDLYSSLSYKCIDKA